MDYVTTIQELKQDPEKLEALYRAALRQGQAGQFEAALAQVRAGQPDNLLYAAWHYRLAAALEAVRPIAWKLAAAAALACAFVFWLLGNPAPDAPRFMDRALPLLVFWAPVAACAMLAFLALASRRNQLLALGLGIGLAAISLFVYLLLPGMNEMRYDHALTVMALHLPLLSGAALGIYLTGWRGAAERRFAFLTRALEVVTVGGLLLIAGFIFIFITGILFEALSIRMPDWVARLVIGGVGLIPVIAVALLYDPHAAPEAQDFNTGLSRFLTSMLRLLVVPTLAVAIIYTLFIPFRFMEPFQNRDMLIAYNVMLFAVMALLLGATPRRADELSLRVQHSLRIAITAIAGLAALVAAYALAAVVYRTFEGGITINRMTIIGWDLINIGLLGWLVLRQVRPLQESWIDSVKQVFNAATIGYAGWALAVVLLVPLLFR